MGAMDATRREDCSEDKFFGCVSKSFYTLRAMQP